MKFNFFLFLTLLKLYIDTMSNNFKEQAAYDYMHNNEGKIKPKYKRSILNKWKRYNCEIAEDRVIRNRKRDTQFRKEMKADLINYYNNDKNETRDLS